MAQDTSGNNKPLILMVDDHVENLQILGNLLEKDYRTAVATNGPEALEFVGRKLPDLILLDVMMPEMDGFEVCKRLKASAHTHDIPVIFLTARTETEDIVTGFQLGAEDYVTKPFNAHELRARVSTYIELKRNRDMIRSINKPGKAPEDDDESSEQTIITTQLKTTGTEQEEHAFILFISGSLLGKMFFLEKNETIIGRTSNADIVIKDFRISRQHARILILNNRIVVEDLKSTNGTFVNAERITAQELQNGDKVLLPGDHVFKLAIGDEAERMFQKEMYQLANNDAVTNIPNKHVFIRHLKEMFTFSKSMDWGLALLMIDVDRFKDVNDTHGHLAGDHVLHGVAQRIRKALRDEDVLARYGGDEMAVILSNIDAGIAVAIAERFRAAIADVPFYYHSTIISVTVSIGVAVFRHNNFTNVEDLIAQADACLYRSKKKGRNRVTF